MIRIGARDSTLSRIQTETVNSAIEELGIKTEIQYFSSKGDKNRITPMHKFGEIGIFTNTLEQKLLNEEIDVAVHSYKDLPVIHSPHTESFPVLKREDPQDLLIIHQESIEKAEHFEENAINVWNEGLRIKSGARIGTSSLRRQSQLLSIYPSISVVDIRGNIETRIKRIKENVIDGLVLAKAALNRMQLKLPHDVVLLELPLRLFPTAPGQGAVAVQIRSNDPIVIKQLQPLIDDSTMKETVLEKEVMSRLGEGCIEPIGITVQHLENQSFLYASRASKDWKKYSVPPIERFYFASLKFEDLITLSSEIELGGYQRHTGENQSKPETPIGKTILISSRDKLSYAQILEKRGAKPILIDTLEFETYPEEEYIPSAFKVLERVDWIAITSSRAVFAAKKLIDLSKYTKKIACVGPSTARKLWQEDIPIHLIASKATGGSLAKDLIRYTPRPRGILHLGARRVHGEFHKILKEADIPVFHVPVYEKTGVSREIKKRSLANTDSKFDYILVFSPSQVEAILSSLEIPDNQKWIAIGPSTAKSLAEKGFSKIQYLSSRTPEALFEVDLV